MLKTQKSSTRKAFTLIELLVVVAVLALLASIVFSNLGGAREGARISNALSFQSQTHSLLGSDLVGWWNFNEGDARDISGYGNNGTITGATSADGVPGTGGSALDFNGVGDYVNISHYDEFPREDITIGFWLYQKEYGSPLAYITKRGSTADGLMFFMFTDNKLFFDWGDGTSSRRWDTGYIPPLNKWVYLVIKRDVNGRYLYVNGNLENYTDVPGGPIPEINNSWIALMRDSAGSRYYVNGLIDDVRIYSRALTASEAQTLYAQTKEKYLANE